LLHTVDKLYNNTEDTPKGIIEEDNEGIIEEDNEGK